MPTFDFDQVEDGGVPVIYSREDELPPINTLAELLERCGVEEGEAFEVRKLGEDK
jgi:hypothetical protein